MGARNKGKMTTLLQEFEEWLQHEYNTIDEGRVAEGLARALQMLEQLKKKHNVK
jgi:uncharacterized protein YutE (UPF0331/DUF86 family)